MTAQTDKQYMDLYNQKVELFVLIATYRSETKDLINREGTKEAVAEFIRNTDRAEANFKRNEGKSDEQ